jgi:hypothetical protein
MVQLESKKNHTMRLYFTYMYSGSLADLLALKTRPSAVASVTSPICVPVPRPVRRNYAEPGHGEHTMGFHVTRCLKVQVTTLVYLANERLLRRLAWLSEAWGMAVLVRASCSNHSTDHVPVPYCIFYSLENKHSNAFSSCIAIGALIEAIAPTIR